MRRFSEEKCFNSYLGLRNRSFNDGLYRFWLFIAASMATLGHSYVECDGDFDPIEKQLRTHQHMYLSQHYRNAIPDTKHQNKFRIHDMAEFL